MYLNFLNYFRGFAIFLIVMGHSFYITNFFNLSNPIGNPFFRKLFFTMTTGGTSLFVFISGFLFHHIFYSRGFNFKKFMKNKLKNVLLPYTIVVIPGLIYAIYQHQLDLFIYEKNKILYTLLYYLSGNALTATWYIPFAMLLFIASPIFIKFIELEDRRQRIIVFLLLIISMIIQRPIRDLTINIFQAFIYFSPFYCLGIYISMNKERARDILEKNILYLGILWGITLALQVRYNILETMQKSIFEIKGIDLVAPEKFFICLFVLGVFMKLEKVENSLGKMITKSLSILADCSFGIFFIHNYFILMFWERYHNGMDMLESLELGIVTIILSTIIVLLFKKIFGKKSRILIGS